MPLLYVGVDPGLKGALAALDQDGIVDVVHMPLLDKKRIDVYAVHEWLKRLQGVDVLVPERFRIVIEKAQAFPPKSARKCPKCGTFIKVPQGAASIAHYMQNYGEIVGLLKGLRLPHQEKTPVTWKRKVLGSKRGENTKAAAIAYVQTRFPDGNDWLYKGRAHKLTKPHDGVADAICIAEYARIAWE